MKENVKPSERIIQVVNTEVYLGPTNNIYINAILNYLDEQHDLKSLPHLQSDFSDPFAASHTEYSNPIPMTPLAWFTTLNPLLGNVSPIDMIKIGRQDKLCKWIVNQIDENTGNPGETKEFSGYMTENPRSVEGNKTIDHIVEDNKMVCEHKPEYYYKGKFITYKEGVDPEATCWHCKKTFLCDCMDATCRLCGAPFDSKRCGEFNFTVKPSDSGGEKEVEELVKHMTEAFHQSIGIGEGLGSFFKSASQYLIKLGYSKHPKSNDLVALDEKEISNIITDNIDWPEEEGEEKCAKLICSKFGTQPKAKVMSVEEIYDLCKWILDSNTPIGTSNQRSSKMIAEAIHAEMLKDNK